MFALCPLCSTASHDHDMLYPPSSYLYPEDNGFLGSGRREAFPLPQGPPPSVHGLSAFPAPGSLESSAFPPPLMRPVHDSPGRHAFAPSPLAPLPGHGLSHHPYHSMSSTSLTGSDEGHSSHNGTNGIGGYSSDRPASRHSRASFSSSPPTGTAHDT